MAIVEKMIRLYCRRHHDRTATPRDTPHAAPCAGADGLCADCRQLLDYARRRLSRCRFGASKPSCRKCPVHCYRPDMRQQMREVMRWAGPRMMFHHPLDALRHLLHEL